MSPNPTRRRRRARGESYAGLSGCRDERACLASEPRAVVHPDVRGRSTTRGGIACEVSRVHVRGLAGWRSTSPGYRVDLFVHIAPSRAGARVVRRWCTCWACVVTPPCATGRCAGSPWSSYHGRRHPVRDRSGWCRRWPGMRGAHGLDVPAAAIGCGIDGLCTRPRCPVRVPSFASGGGRTSLWTLPDAAMDTVGRRPGHCPAPLWTLSGATVDIIRPRLDIAGCRVGHYPAPPWSLSSLRTLRPLR